MESWSDRGMDKNLDEIVISTVLRDFRLNRPLSIATAVWLDEDREAPVITNRTITWAYLVDRVKANYVPLEDHRFMLGEARDGAEPLEPEIVNRSGLNFGIDDPKCCDDILNLLVGHAAVVIVDRHACWLFMPFNRSVTPDEYRRVAEGVLSWIGKKPYRGDVTNPDSWVWRVPGWTDDEWCQDISGCWVIDGDPLDVDALLK